MNDAGRFKHLVTIATYINPVDAQIAKSKLDGEKIPAFLKDENMANIYGPTMVGGMQLQVPHNYVNDALEVLEIDAPAYLVQPDHCPVCFSNRIERYKRTWWQQLKRFLAQQRGHSDFDNANWHCRECGYFWE